MWAIREDAILRPRALPLGACGAQTKSARTAGTAIKKVPAAKAATTLEPTESPAPWADQGDA